MPMPKDIKDAVDDAPDGDIKFDVVAESDIPPLEWFDMHMVKVRDDIARNTGAVPEDVKLIGIRVFYRVGEEIEGRKAYLAIGTRCKYDPSYKEMLEQI